MRQPGLHKGDEAYVSVRINRKMCVDFLIDTINSHEVACELWGDVDVDFIAVDEALKAALGGVAHQLEKPRLKKLLQDRIAQLKRESEEAEREDPPAPSTDDIPF